MRDGLIAVLVIIGLGVAIYSAYILIALFVGFVIWLALPYLRKITEVTKPPIKRRR